MHDPFYGQNSGDTEHKNPNKELVGVFYWLFFFFFFIKVQIVNYTLWNIWLLSQLPPLCCWGIEAATHTLLTNECGFVSIKLYISRD